MTRPSSHPLLWLEPGDDFPQAAQAWAEGDPAPGLLAAGGDLQVATLARAYSRGIFPWFSEGQPILWWSPNPRMVLPLADFKLHRSLRKSLQRFLATPGCQVRIDHDFAAVLAACADAPRPGQSGTWIVPPMQQAYRALHEAGLAHSVEIWVGGQLVGGLYCTAIGGAVFGESMFARQTDASKIALAALVALCRGQGVTLIDCQQNTSHLASLGARPITRDDFCQHMAQQALKKPLHWRAESVYWHLLDSKLGAPASPEPLLPTA
jgi:leucyl/phenylalanyl-tRNA---protein transferase